MRRLLSLSVLTAVASAALVVAPVAAEPAKAHPVAPVLRTHGALTGADAFTTIGASWLGEGSAEVRARVDGRWSAWTALEANDNGEATSGRVTSPPVWVGHATGWQARAHGVRDLKVVTVDAGTSPADDVAARGAAQAAAAQPTVYTRAQWGADESLRSFNGSSCTTPKYSSTIKVGFVHHTDGSNDYTANDTPAVIRGIYAYHVKTNGWCDVGYNFLVDQFGRVWEGRYGGIDKPVIGAHTGGHNVNSFGTALLGTYTDVTPSPRMQSALEGLLAWKLSLHHRDPTGTAELTSAGGGTSRYPKGTTNTFDVISGHRDAGNTACPGDAAYALLPTLRTHVRTLMGAGLVNPTQSATSVVQAGAPVTVTAGVLEQQAWTLDVRNADGVLVRSYAGATATTLSQQVDLKDSAGAWLPVGTYSLTLSSSAGTDQAVPWTGTLAVTSSTAPPPETPVATTYTAITPNRVLDTRTEGTPLGPQEQESVQITGTTGVPSSGVAAVVVNVTGVATGGATFVSAFPADKPWPGTSSLNLAKGQTHAALVVPKVSPDGSIALYNGRGSTHLVVDVVGWYATTGASKFTSVLPARVLDTRLTKTPMGQGSSTTLTIAGKAGVPSDATAVVANLTLTRVTGPGYATVYPATGQRPGTSSINVSRGETASNRVVVGLSNGNLTIDTAVDRADVVLDVVGWYGGSAATSYTSLTPSRRLDTRTGDGTPSGAVGKVAAGSTTRVVFGGYSGVPADAVAVVLTLTTTGVTKDGFVTAWQSGVERPTASDINSWAGHDVANLVVVKLASRGANFYNGSDPVHLVGDVVGYYR